MEQKQMVALIEKAIAAREYSYSPYSNYMVGAFMTFDSVNVNVGGSAFTTLSGYMTDASEMDISKATVTYTSLDTNVAEVTQDGEVIGRGEGTARIKVEIVYGGYTVETVGEIPVRAFSETENSYVYSFNTVYCNYITTVCNLSFYSFKS